MRAGGVRAAGCSTSAAKQVGYGEPVGLHPRPFGGRDGEHEAITQQRRHSRHRGASLAAAIKESDAQLRSTSGNGGGGRDHRRGDRTLSDNHRGTAAPVLLLAEAARVRRRCGGAARLLAALSEQHFRGRCKAVGRHLKVERRGPAPDAPRAVVVATMAGAVPPVVVAAVRDRDAAEVRAHAQNNEPANEGVVRFGHMRSSCDTPSQRARLFVDWTTPDPDTARQRRVGRLTHHFGSLTRSASVCLCRSSAVLVSASSLICSSVRCLMKTGLPRHLTVIV